MGRMTLWSRYKDTIAANWHLGFTAFGGAPVQFQIVSISLGKEDENSKAVLTVNQLHRKFVEELGWIDEVMFQQIFGISQALPGSASVKMLFCINMIHGGYMAGFLAFFLFCLPGAIGMYVLSVGILRVGSTLPMPVFALLSGLNAATVGIIALAAVRLAEKAITDKVTRALVYLGGILGMLHTALWYYPVIMVGAGLTTMVWDLRCPHAVLRLLRRCRRRSALERRLRGDLERHDSDSSLDSQSSLEKPLPPLPLVYKRDRHDSLSPPPLNVPRSRYAITPSRTENLDLKPDIPAHFPAMSWKIGAGILILFVATFVTILVLNTMYPNTSRGFSLFADLYLAGTIIFGGGPVVIPLLREYIVTQGWVSPRNFLLGLAVIQAFPGPNFNFAVYLGSLATAGTSLPSAAGAMIAFVGIFTPGVIIVLGFMGLWSILKSRMWFLSILRGVNAAAVGLVYTAVYKLWEMGYLTAVVQGGSPLGTDPWLVAITATAFVGCAWFKLNPPMAILLGGTMGMLKFAAVRS